MELVGCRGEFPYRLKQGIADCSEEGMASRVARDQRAVSRNLLSGRNDAGTKASDVSYLSQFVFERGHIVQGSSLGPFVEGVDCDAVRNAIREEWMRDGLKSIFMEREGLGIGSKEFLKGVSQERLRFRRSNAIEERGPGTKFLIVEVAYPEGK
jgi:hypothetical protein